MCREVAKKFTALLLSVCMIAGMVDWSGLAVVHAEVSPLMSIEISPDITWPTYDGTEKTLDESKIQVKDELGDPVAKDGNWTISYRNNTNAGQMTAEIIVTGEGNYADNTPLTKKFTILPRNIASAGITFTANPDNVSVLNDGKAETEVEGMDGTTRLEGVKAGLSEQGKDFKYSFSNNEVSDTNPKATGTVSVEGIGNYTGTNPNAATFNIEKLQASNLTVEFGTNTPKTLYTGEAVEYTKDITVKYNGTELRPEQYRLEYKNNVSATVNGAEVYAIGVGDPCNGLKSAQPATFSIVKNISSGASFLNKYPEKGWKVTVDEQRYKGTGTPVTLTQDDIHITDPDGGTVENSEWEIDETTYVNHTVPSTPNKPATVTIKGKGGRYNGERVIEYQIVASKLDKDMVHILNKDELVYDGLNWSDRLQIQVGDTPDVYKEGTDYTIEPISDPNQTKNATTGQGYTFRVKIIPTGQLTSATDGKNYVDINYQVKQQEISRCSINTGTYPLEGEEYTGEQIKPKPVLEYTWSDGTKETLVEGTDYDVTYRNNIDATPGDSEFAVIVATGKKNFKGTKEKDFQIKQKEIKLYPDDPDGNVELANFTEVYTYNGSPIEASFNLQLRGTTNVLSKGTDYTVEYPNGHTDVGTWPILVRGNKNYKGSFNKNIQIDPQDISAAGITVRHDTKIEYTGNVIKPEVTITHNKTGLKLEEGRDYDIIWPADSELVDVGEKIFTIQAKGNYTGTRTQKFNITQCDISKMSNLSILGPDATGVLDQYDFLSGSYKDRAYAYDGTQARPEFKVLRGDTILTLQTDYSVKYGENVKIGKASAVITGEGNYSGTKTVEFCIKGNLENINYTKITIPEQPYNAGVIVPKGVEVTFDGEKLEEGTHFRVENADKDHTTPVGQQAEALIIGMGDFYFGTAHEVFHVRKFDLSTDIGDGKEFVISNLKDKYTYSRLAVKPEPVIKHNGVDVVYGTDYQLKYYKLTNAGNKEEEISEPRDVGKYQVEIIGDGDNYTGSTTWDYEIIPYDIGEGYTAGDILPSGYEDVILDELKENYTGDALYNPGDGQVTWDNTLKLEHIPTDWQDVKHPDDVAEMDKTADYSAAYEKNDTIGRAEIKIKAKGKNYTGEFSVYFQIRGDLTNARLTVEDWTYTPPAEENGQMVQTNRSKPTVVYTVEYQDEGKENKEITLTEGIHYSLEWENNDKATKSDADTFLPGIDETTDAAIVKVIATSNPDGSSGEDGTGDYVNSNQAGFHIIQRDLSNTIGENKDELLELSGFNLEEPKYEYTGQPIVPDISITCAGGEVKKKTEATAGDDFDYEVTAVNNLDAFEWLDGVVEGTRLMPLMTVSAKQNADGNYTGNYKGSFQHEFTVTPRQIGPETIDTTDYPIEGVIDRDYTGAEIMFPVDENTPVVVTWYKMIDGNMIHPVLTEGVDYELDHRNNIKIGPGELIIRGVKYSNYEGEYVKEFKIIASIEEVDKENPVYMSLEYDDNVPYGVTEVYPDLKFIDISGVMCGQASEEKILELGEDFDIIVENSSEPSAKYGTSKNNINVANYDREHPSDPDYNQNSPTVVVRGKNYYRGEVRRYYNITPKDLSDESITVKYLDALDLEGYENAYVYTGSAIEPKIQVFNGENLMELGTDYTVTGYDNNVNLSTEGGKAKIHIAAVEGGNYIGTRTFEFEIVPKPIAQMQVTIANENQIYYDRTAKRPAVSVFYRDGNKKIDLVEGTDYTVDYGNYVDAAKKDEEDESKRPTIILRGIGGYGGEKRVTYTILPENIANEEDIEVTGRLLYTGGSGPFKPVFTVKAKDGTVLREVTEENGAGDYTVAEYTGTPTIGGEGTTTITGVGNYTGTRSVKFRIIPPEGTIQIAEIPDESYNSMPHNPEVKVSLLVEKENISIDLVEGTDYEVSYSNNINAGTATVTVKGIGDFANQRPAVKNFTIMKRGIGTGLALMDYIAFTPIPDQQYTGRGITPQVQLVYRDVYENSAGTQENIERTLVAGNDYVVSYSNNVAVGTATATITGINNYSGSYRTTFRIYGNMNMATVAEIPTQEYTGSPVTPVPDVSFGGKKLTEGTDYTLEYKNNTERGTATIVITGLGQYTGTKTVTFTIAKELSDSTSVKGVAAAYTYTGSAIKPPVRVEDNGTVLTNGRDYQVSYKDNVNAGTATITITGMDKYRGSKTVTFKISPQQLGRATVAKIGDKTYTGKDMKPSIKVTSGNVTLKNNTDYTVVYVGGKTPGRASVIIKGAGNFTGTQTVSYNITVPKMSGAKVSKYTKDSLTFSWKKNNVVSGYEIYNSKNRREKKITKKTTVKGTVSKLSAGKSYTFRIRSYVSKGGKYYYGPFTTIKTATAPKSTKISKLTSSKKKQVTVKWNKVSGATQYEIYRSTSKKGKYTKIGTSKKTSYTDKKATGGKKYYYKVRVCKTISKKNYYSSYSSVKSVKAKK